MSEPSEINLIFKELESLKRNHSIHPDCSLSIDLSRFALIAYELGAEMVSRKFHENFLKPFIPKEN